MLFWMGANCSLKVQDDDLGLWFCLYDAHLNFMGLGERRAIEPDHLCPQFWASGLWFEVQQGQTNLKAVDSTDISKKEHSKKLTHERKLP